MATAAAADLSVPVKDSTAKQPSMLLVVSIIAVGLIALGLGVGLGVGLQRTLTVTSTPPAWTSTTFVITVGKSTFAFEDVNSTENVGDAVFYWQNFSVNGEPAGYVFGQRTTMITAAATQAYTGIEGIVVDDVVTYYRFFTGEQIMMAGSLVLPANQFAPGLRLNEPQQRLILGGTGKWKGATGVGTLIRNTDGTYTHRVELLRPNPAAIVSVKYNV